MLQCFCLVGRFSFVLLSLPSQFQYAVRIGNTGLRTSSISVYPCTVYAVYLLSCIPYSRWHGRARLESTSKIWPACSSVVSLKLESSNLYIACFCSVISFRWMLKKWYWDYSKHCIQEDLRAGEVRGASSQEVQKGIEQKQKGEEIHDKVTTRGVL